MIPLTCGISINQSCRSRQQKGGCQELGEGEIKELLFSDEKVLEIYCTDRSTSIMFIVNRYCTLEICQLRGGEGNQKIPILKALGCCQEQFYVTIFGDHWKSGAVEDSQDITGIGKRYGRTPNERKKKIFFLLRANKQRTGKSKHKQPMCRFFKRLYEEMEIQFIYSIYSFIQSLASMTSCFSRFYSTSLAAIKK